MIIKNSQTVMIKRSNQRELLRARRTLSVLAALLLWVIISPAADKREFKVGVLYWSTNIGGQVAMKIGLETEAEKINRDSASNGLPSVKLFTRVAGDGQKGIENQIRQMQEMVESGMDVIIVQPTDNAALIGPLKAANKAKIPVIAYDQYISGGKLTAYRTSDNYQAGYLDGEYIASKFSTNKTMRIVLVDYPHVSSTVERVNGFLDALSHARKPYKILKSFVAVEPAGGKKAAEDILKMFPKSGSIDVVFTVNDGGGLAVVNGLAEAGRKEIMVATIDGDPQSVDNIKKGRLTVINSAQFCGPLGAEAMKAAYQVIAGKPVIYHALVPVFPVTIETLGIYKGWLGPIPDDFTKQWECREPVWQGRLKIVK